MKKIPFLLLFLPLLLSGCLKDKLFEGYSDTPVFSTTGNFGGTPYAFVAGKDSVYLFTSFKNISDIEMQESSARFANQTCINGGCPGTLQFIFRSQLGANIAELPANLPFLVDSVYNDFSYPIAVYPFLDTAVFSTVRVMVGDQEAVSNNTLPLFANLLSNNQRDISVTALSRDEVKVVNRVSYLPSDPDSCKALTVDLTVKDNAVHFVAFSTQSQVEYGWSNGAFGAEQTMEYIPGETYTVSVTDPDSGCNASVEVSNLPNIEGLKLSAPNVSVISNGTQETTRLEGVEIRWIDSTGVVYSSSGNIQYENAFFTILKSESYLDNENGVPTLMLKVKYFCVLNGLMGNGFPAASTALSGEGVIAVGRKQ